MSLEEQIQEKEAHLEALEIALADPDRSVLSRNMVKATHGIVSQELELLRRQKDAPVAD